uniref:OBP47-like domain-containing protein n=1 Tax=Anopheles epiroticus TaxID=199890 RepID=A0A182P219_9DIPT
MASSVVRSCSWAKVVVLLLGLVQLATAGEPNPACSTIPSVDKDSEEKCCDIPSIFPNETMQHCVGEIEKSTKPQLQKSCDIANCMLKKQNLLKSDNRVDLDKVKSFIKDTMQGSDEWKALAEKAVLEECLPMIEKDTSNVMSSLKSSMGDCNPVPALLIACAAAKFYAHCPSKDWTGSPMCDEWKSFLGKCSNSLEDMNAVYTTIESKKMR